MKDSPVDATVVVPTTGNRGILLPYSVGSILGQSVENLEVFVIGDGVTDETRALVKKLQSDDDRVRFFDHPKGESRGEIYRHQALMNHARGEIVCYLCDRDMMLPDHVETMLENLRDHNFAANWGIALLANGRTRMLRRHFGEDLAERLQRTNRVGLGLSFVGHRLDFYKALPHGWRVTPPGSATDGHMWRQFLNHPDCKPLSTSNITLLYFKRGVHPGWPAEQRARELAYYFPLLQDNEGIRKLKEAALENMVNGYFDLKERIRRMRRHLFLIRGRTVSELFEESRSRITRNRDLPRGPSG